VLCLTGDRLPLGAETDTTAVFDLDATGLLALASKLPVGTDSSARAPATTPLLYLGAVENPFIAPTEERAERALAKAQAGASFFQLQMGFETAPLADFMARAHDVGLFERAHVLATVCVVDSARALRFVRDRLPGVSVPDDVVERIEEIDESEQAPACRELAVDYARHALSLPGIAGLHHVSFGGASALAELRACTDGA